MMISRTSEELFEFLFDVIACVSIALWFAAPSTLIFQAMIYLKTGIWHPVSLQDGLGWLGERWGFDPHTTWVVFDQVCESLPLSAAFLASAVLIFVMSMIATTSLARAS